MSQKEDKDQNTKPDSAPADSLLPVPVKKNDRALASLDPLSAYLSEIRKYEDLDAQEEFDIAVQYQKTGDPALAYKLITSNLQLVVKIAMTFRREWQNLMDLVQEGNVGLMKAVKNFDPFRGARLPGYAGWWIKAYILKYLLDNWRLVRVGTTNTRRKLLYNLKKEKERLEQEGYVPTTKLLAENFGVDEQEVIDVEASLGAADVSMDAPIGDDESFTPMHTLTRGEVLESSYELEQLRALLREKVERFLVDAKPIERDLVDKRILCDDPLPLQEIGNQYKITREAVRQAEQRLLKKLKEYLNEELPEAADYFKS